MTPRLSGMTERTEATEVLQNFVLCFGHGGVTGLSGEGHLSPGIVLEGERESIHLHGGTIDCAMIVGAMLPAAVGVPFGKSTW